MRAIAQFLKHHLWIVFVVHQSVIFLIAVAFLTSIRRLTGRTIHLGQDPVGSIDGAALLVLSVGVIVFTAALYRWVKGKNGPSLGIALSPRRFLQLVIGLLLGFILITLPYAISVSAGTAFVRDHITDHFGTLTVVRFIAIGFFLLLLQSVMEETANRAFPMRLWEHRSLLFRILVPSIFFAAIHLADEGLGLERFINLLMGGITQSFAYALTGNIWLASGLHAGANLASFSVSGLWHAGAVVALVGQLIIPNWLVGTLLLLTFGLLFVLKTARTRKSRIGLNV